MTWRAVLAWGAGVWLMAGLEAALGTGFPGPLLLLALAAGLSSSATTGAVLGGLAGCLSAVLSGSHLFMFVVIGVGAGLLAHIAGRYFSRRHVLVAVVVALGLTFGIALVLGLFAGLSWSQALAVSGRHSVTNALWIVPIYGTVLVYSARRTSMTPWEYH